MPIRKILNFDQIVKLQQELKPITGFFNEFKDTPVIITDEFANIIFVNNATELVSGYTRQEIIGKTPGDLWGGFEEDGYYEVLWHTIKLTKKQYSGIVLNKKKDLTPIMQKLTIQPILNDLGDINFYIGIEPVVTDTKTKETILPRKLERFMENVSDKKITLPGLIGIIDYIKLHSI